MKPAYQRMARSLLQFGFMALSNLITPIRVDPEVEIEGLDGPEMGIMAPDFALHPGQHM